MVRKVIWTAVAFRDFEDTHTYIAKDSPKYAASFARKVLEKTRSLGHWADFGAMIPEFDDEQIREVRVSRYRLIYRLLPDCVVLLGLIHGARDLTGVWERENRPR